MCCKIAPLLVKKNHCRIYKQISGRNTCKMCCKIAPLLVKNHCMFYKYISHRKHTQMSVLHTYTFVNARVFKNDTCRCWITCVQLQFYKCVFFFLLQNQHTHEQISAYTRVLFFCDYKCLPPSHKLFCYRRCERYVAIFECSI